MSFHTRSNIPKGRSFSMAKRIATDKEGVFYREIEGDKPSKPARAYYIRYRRGGRGGKLIEEPVGKSTQGMTTAKAANIRALRITGKETSNVEKRVIERETKEATQNRWTIQRLWDEYKRNKPGLKGIVTDENRYKNYLSPFASRTPEEVSTTDVDRLRLQITSSGKSQQTAKNVLELFRRIINFGVKKGFCHWQDPSRLHFEMPKVNNQRTEMLTKEQREKLLVAAAADPNRKAANIVLLAYLTGMRRMEIFRLKWEHIDWEQGFIRIVGEGQSGAKSGKDEIIPLSEAVCAFLGSIERSESPYVFPGRDGVSQLTDINKQVNRIKRAAGLDKDFRPLHGLRHTFASVAVSNGVPLSIVQKLLTHKSPQLTQRYAHLEDGALKNAANSIGKLLKANN